MLFCTKIKLQNLLRNDFHNTRDIDTDNNGERIIRISKELELNPSFIEELEILNQ